MPVGSQGTVKALAPEEVKDIGYGMILANTYPDRQRWLSGLQSGSPLQSQ